MNLSVWSIITDVVYFLIGGKLFIHLQTCNQKAPTDNYCDLAPAVI